MNREKRIIMTSSIGIGGNIALVALKAIVGLITASVSIILDAVNNLTDALSSIITIVGTKLANKRPDKKHPFGYGRIEYLTSMLISFLILFAGGTAIYESIQSIVHYWTIDFPKGSLPSSYSIVTLVLIGVGILFKIGIGVFFKIQAKKANSDALDASGTDALWDSVLSAGTLVGAIIVYTAGFYTEGYIGVVIGIFIIKAGISTMLDSLSQIVGERIDDQLAHQMKSDVCSVEGVKGAYDLIVNSYGLERSYGSVHVEVDDNLTAKEIQSIERKVTYLLFEKYHIIFTIGIYAQNDSTPQLKEMKDTIRKICKEDSNILQLHGFYVDEETKSMNFDLVISFNEKQPEALAEKIRQKVIAVYPDYHCFIAIDQDIAG